MKAVAAVAAVAVAALAVGGALASMSVPTGRNTRFLAHHDPTKDVRVTVNEPKICDPDVQQCT